MIKKFNAVTGQSIDTIIGQERYGFATADFVEIYDLEEWQENGGYQGSELRFYDFETGEVYIAFSKKRNRAYTTPKYIAGKFYILTGDYNSQEVTLFSYLPGESPNKLVVFNMQDINLYNLEVMGNSIHIVSQDPGENFFCYYPEKFSFDLEDNESVIFIDGDKIYTEKWIEEGWDDEKNVATSEYRYYNKVLVRDFSGKILSEEIGALNQRNDGSWWIS